MILFVLKYLKIKDYKYSIIVSFLGFFFCLFGMGLWESFRIKRFLFFFFLDDYVIVLGNNFVV